MQGHLIAVVSGYTFEASVSEWFKNIEGSSCSRGDDSGTSRSGSSCTRVVVEVDVLATEVVHGGGSRT